VPRILISTFGSFGDVNPYIGLGLALQRRGHEPILAMPGIYRQAVEGEGLGFRAIRPDVDPDDHAFIARLMDPARGTEAIFGEWLLPSLRATWEDLLAASEGVDLFVTHPASLLGPVVADVRQRPWASTVLAPMSFFSVTDPVVPPPAPWLHAWLERSEALSRLFVWLADRITRQWARPVREFRRSLGLAAGANPILAGQHSPHLVLAMFASALGPPQADWPARTVVTGPVLYNGAAEPSVSAELERFLASGPAPIVFTLGSSAVEAAGDFYEVSASAVRAMNRRAVMLVGRHARNRPALADDRILVLDYAPHAALFPRAAAIVHQGGAGTLHQALASGRPMLVVPHAHDQPDNAHRATRLGVARTLYPKRYSAGAVAREIGALLDEPAYRDRARAIAAGVRAEDGAVRASEAIDRLLADGRRPPGPSSSASAPDRGGHLFTQAPGGRDMLPDHGRP